MQNFIKKYSSYFEPKAIKMIEKCLIISCIFCLFSVLLLSFYNTYYISFLLYESSLTLFRVGLIIGIFPSAFVLVIGKYKKDQNL